VAKVNSSKLNRFDAAAPRLQYCSGSPGQSALAAQTWPNRTASCPPLEEFALSDVTAQAGLTWGAGVQSAATQARTQASLDYCWSFFVGQSEAQLALRKLVDILERDNLPYAIIGALALNEYGHRRVTVDVDLVMTDAALQVFKGRYLGHGYAERVVGTGKLLDTDFNVHVDVLSSGRFPGDDKPKPIAFPDPATTAIRGKPFALLPIAMWIELKLASGMVAAHRGKDLVDVQELIRSAGLPQALAEELHPWVRQKFLELWALAQIEDF